MGQKGGVICRIEQLNNNPVHWCVCLLHGNELLLRHYFDHIDGMTTGPTSLSGPVGMQLPACHDLPIIKFQAIASLNMPDIPNEVLQDMSTDQQYMYQIVQAVSKGEVSTVIAKLKPGPINHARWLTKANRVLRLYVSTCQPSSSLVKLATFVMQVYAPAWFIIRQKETIGFGASHFLWMWNATTRLLVGAEQKVVLNVLQRNSYFAHSEQILLNMLLNDEMQVRLNAVEKIQCI